MRVAIYIRVSTEEQAADGYSLSAQERLCRSYATSHGWEVAEVYADEGLSGRNDRRPALRRLREDAEAKRFDGVIVHKLDRLARNLKLTLELIEEFRSRKIDFVSVVEQLDLTTPMGWAMFQVQGVFAEFYSRNLSQETIKGRREKAQQGWWVGPIPIGYERDERGELVPSEDAPLVQRIFSLYASRLYSYADIADDLNRDGCLTTGRYTGKRVPFGRESVRCILINEAYIGRVSSKMSFPGRHKPLVSEELFRLVEEIRMERTQTQRAPVRSSEAWLLGVLYCEHCGGRYWHQFGNRNSAGRYYRCSGIPRRVCKAPMVRADVVEGQMLRILRRLSVPAELLPQIMAEAEQLAKISPRAEPVEDTTDHRQQQLRDALAAGILTHAEYSKKSKALDRSRPRPGRVSFNMQQAEQRLREMPLLLDHSLPCERMALVKSLFEKAWVDNRNIVRLTPRADVGEILVGVLRVCFGVPDGFRTHNPLIHSQVLCH